MPLIEIPYKMPATMHYRRLGKGNPCCALINANPRSPLTAIAVQIELRGPVNIECSPYRFNCRLSVCTNSGRLVRFVKSLEVEQIDSPVKQTAHAILPKGFCV